MLTQERLKQVVTYNPDTGEFIWNMRGTTIRCEGQVAGSISSSGYRYITVDNKNYLDGRLAFLYMEGSFPADGFEVDHLDRRKLNCKWNNLRLATRSQNMHNLNLACNNTSGIKGVNGYKTTGRWQAYIYHNKKRIPLGYYGTKEEAAKVVEAKRLELHKSFASFGSTIPSVGALL
jgi:hypothetical protein